MSALEQIPAGVADKLLKAAVPAANAIWARFLMEKGCRVSVDPSGDRACAPPSANGEWTTYSAVVRACAEPAAAQWLAEYDAMELQP